jgi:hypothetical protein
MACVCLKEGICGADLFFFLMLSITLLMPNGPISFPLGEVIKNSEFLKFDPYLILFFFCYKEYFLRSY